MKDPINIPRKKYLEKIIPYFGSSLIKVITGQRRVGKSFLMKQAAEYLARSEPEAKIIYINKEDYAFEKIRTYQDLMEFIQSHASNKAVNYIFIDEIQDIKKFELALRSLILDRQYDITISGSNASILSGELSTYLAGRTIEIPIHSLGYDEYLQFNQTEDSPENFMRYIQYGGMPQLCHLPKNDDIAREYLRNVLNTIILRDIVMRYNIRNIRFINDLLSFLADSAGSIVSAKRISDDLKSQQIRQSTKVILEYLFYLESVFCVHRVKRAAVEGRKIFEIGDKFYFEDLGLRHALIPYQQKDIQKVLENLVFHRLLEKGYQVHIGKMGDKEVDFLAQKDNKTVYLQVCYLIPDEKTHQREFGNLLAIPDNYPKMVISMDESAGGNYKGIEHRRIRDFLLDDKIL